MAINRLFIKFVRWVGYDLGITPNQITIGRLFFFVPGWFMWLYRHEIAAWLGIWWQLVGLAAFLLVTTVIVFDLVDGALARETGQVSRKGKILDPAVDKFITYSTLALFWPVIHKPGLIILFVLDIASTFLRGVQVEGANTFGKKKALCQNLSKLFFGAAVLLSFRYLNIIGNILIWASVVLATISVSLRMFPPAFQEKYRHILPNALTTGNLLSGIAALWFITEEIPEYAILLIFLAMAFDFSDGILARKFKTVSNFGKNFDTIADLTSFGAVPATLVAKSAWSTVGIITGIFYFLTTCLRLYDYGRTKDRTPTGFFRGLPSPAAAWLIASTSLWLPYPYNLTFAVFVGCLMCTFFVNWQHFNRIAPTLKFVEIIAAILIGLPAALLGDPSGFLLGPAAVYVFSPLWRRPTNGSS